MLIDDFEHHDRKFIDIEVCLMFTRRGRLKEILRSIIANRFYLNKNATLHCWIRYKIKIRRYYQ